MARGGSSSRRPSSGAAPLEELQASLEREYLADLHARHGGDLEAMAAVLRISTRALYDRLRKLGIRPRDLRGDRGS